ncbi:MAG TPA: dihydrolipoyllysine-residue succinyltransferase [Thiobacillus sp.]|nr:MAG: dihydrolipoamide succinyltransferase [Hydrogenophilales bacterium 12-64-13]OYZ03952.1 MAG: dihydrolipoamide succinyltransferase [Hydrogenophilales bacterium 16-64-46]OZA36650.1 MAG: dihydrolipoamide succinyltransferase [Hydrogenophilales bacterium 17-64-34]HQS83011.1 dihydrolipoyllysine-residue succinyltransferase [Thiobacillus sp.]HQT01158.1 dihydrolipoyllysine-residue succinyltransferase [Thiobacillus sp.]
MKIDVRVPTLSDSVASGTLLTWRRQPGDTVARDETLVDLETDKVILDIPAPVSGTLLEIRQPEGTVVKADEVVAVIESGDTTSAAAPAAPVAPPAAAPVAPSPPVAVARPAVSPPVPLPPPPTGQPPAAAGTRREPMSRLRARVAERLVAAQHTAALLTTFNEVNMQPVNELRQRMKAEFEVKHGVKLGYMSFFVRAVCRALAQFPVIHASIDGTDIVWHDDADIGIAISTPRGLVVPILRRAQTLAAHQIEAAIADFAARARDGRLALEELAGGTFSITNGGVFGSLLSTPIVNPPQSAILGMHTIQDRPVAEHGQVVVRPMMYLALSYDHRLIDGRDAVQFLAAVKAALEAPDSLLD